MLYELVHIWCNDVVVNFFQIVVEMLFFYHFVVWWVSDLMWCECENCCDDVVVEFFGDVVIYVWVLIVLEVMSVRMIIRMIGITFEMW